MSDSFAFVVVTLIIILGFEAVDGWTDAPNAIATVVSTRVRSLSKARRLAEWTPNS
jgi:phosphate/sulfate permease